MITIRINRAALEALGGESAVGDAVNRAVHRIARRWVMRSTPRRRLAIWYVERYSTYKHLN